MLRLSALQAVAKARSDLEKAERGQNIATPAPKTIPLEDYYAAADEEIEVLLAAQREQFERFRLLLEHEARQQERNQRSNVGYSDLGGDGLSVTVPSATPELLATLSDHLPYNQRSKILQAMDDAADHPGGAITGSPTGGALDALRRRQIAQALLAGDDGTAEAISTLKDHASAAKTPVPRLDEGPLSIREWGSNSNLKASLKNAPTEELQGGVSQVVGGEGSRPQSASSLRLRFRSEKEQRIFLLSRMRDPVLGERLRVVPNPYKIRKEEEEARRKEEAKARQLTRALAQTKLSRTQHRSGIFNVQSVASPRTQSAGSSRSGDSSSSNYDYNDFYLDDNGHSRGSNAKAADVEPIVRVAFPPVGNGLIPTWSSGGIRVDGNYPKSPQGAVVSIIRSPMFGSGDAHTRRGSEAGDSEAEHQLKARTLKLLKPLTLKQACQVRSEFHVLEDTLKMLEQLKGGSGGDALSVREKRASSNLPRDLLSISPSRSARADSELSIESCGSEDGDSEVLGQLMGGTKGTVRRLLVERKSTSTHIDSRYKQDDDTPSHKTSPSLKDTSSTRMGAISRWHASREKHLHEQYRHHIDAKVTSSIQQATSYQQHHSLQLQLHAIHQRAAELDTKRNGGDRGAAKVPTAAEIALRQLAAKNRYALGEVCTQEELDRARIVADERSIFAMNIRLPFDEQMGILRPRRNLLPPIIPRVALCLAPPPPLKNSIESVPSRSASFNVAGALAAFGGADASVDSSTPPVEWNPDMLVTRHESVFTGDRGIDYRRLSVPNVRHQPLRRPSNPAVSPRTAAASNAAKRGSIFAPKNPQHLPPHHHDQPGGMLVRRLSAQPITGLPYSWDANTAAIITPAAVSTRRGSHETPPGGILQSRTSVSSPAGRSRRPSTTANVVTLLSLSADAGTSGGDSGRRASYESAANSSGGGSHSTLYVEPLARLAPLPLLSDTNSTVPMSVRMWETNFFAAPTTQAAVDAVLRTQGIAPSTFTDHQGSITNSARRLSAQPIHAVGGWGTGGSLPPRERVSPRGERTGTPRAGAQGFSISSFNAVANPRSTTVGSQREGRTQSPVSNASYVAPGTPHNLRRSVSSGFSNPSAGVNIPVTSVRSRSPSWSEAGDEEITARLALNRQQTRPFSGGSGEGGGAKGDRGGVPRRIGSEEMDGAPLGYRGKAVVDQQLPHRPPIAVSASLANSPAMPTLQPPPSHQGSSLSRSASPSMSPLALAHLRV